jgi:hypothetical protein
MSYNTLTKEQIHSFLDKGYRVVDDCLNLDIAKQWINESHMQMGLNQDDPVTWEKDLVFKL